MLLLSLSYYITPHTMYAVAVHLYIRVRELLWIPADADVIALPHRVQPFLAIDLLHAHHAILRGYHDAPLCHGPRS